MEISDEVVPIFIVKGHESATHDDELYFVDIVAYLFQLFNSVPSLDVGIISSSDSSHRSRFITSIGLS